MRAVLDLAAGAVDAFDWLARLGFLGWLLLTLADLAARLLWRVVTRRHR